MSIRQYCWSGSRYRGAPNFQDEIVYKKRPSNPDLIRYSFQRQTSSQLASKGKLWIRGICRRYFSLPQPEECMKIPGPDSSCAFQWERALRSAKSGVMGQRMRGSAWLPHLNGISWMDKFGKLVLHNFNVRKSPIMFFFLSLFFPKKNWLRCFLQYQWFFRVGEENLKSIPIKTVD